MSDHPIDPDTLAALLDGRLDAAERERVLAQLARDEASYEAFLEASAVLRELEGSSAAASPPAANAEPPPPLGLVTGSAAAAAPAPVVARRRWPWKLPAAAGALLAAGVAGVLLMPRGDADPLAAARAVAGAPAGDWTRPVWPAVRGEEEALSPRARAFRAGVRLAQLEVAAARGDTGALATASLSLDRLARSVPGGAGAGRRIDAAAQGSAATRDSLADELRAVLGEAAWLDLGAWSEAARLAARARDERFFAAEGAPRQALARLLAEAGGAEHPALALLREVAATGGVPEAAVLDSAIARGGR